MSALTRFTELETGIEVSVFTPFPWGDAPITHVVMYPGSKFVHPETGEIAESPGRSYSVSEETLNKHFAIVTPQNVQVMAFGAVYDRPTPKQKELG